MSTNIKNFYAMSDSADTCPTFSNFLSVNQKAPKWRLIFIADAFPPHLSLNQKYKKSHQNKRAKTIPNNEGGNQKTKTRHFHAAKQNTKHWKYKKKNWKPKRTKEKRQSEKLVHKGVTPLFHFCF